MERIPDYRGDKEYMACVADIMAHPIFQSMDQYIQHGTTTCKVHCIQVSYCAYKLCVKYGGNARSAARAGLLHDLFLYDWHTRARETGEHFHGFTHPRTALNNAVKYFELTDEEKNIILCHMWPLTVIPPATRAGFAVTWADKVCCLAETTARMKKRLWAFFVQPAGQ